MSSFLYTFYTRKTKWRKPLNINDRITIILGAGAMVEATTLSCASITAKVIEKQQREFVNGEFAAIPLLKIIYEKLLMYHGTADEAVNFEDIFHVLEMWNSLLTAQNPKVQKRFRSIFGMLGDLKEDLTKYSSMLLYSGMSSLIDTVIALIAENENRISENEWFSNFLEAIVQQSPVDVFSLNYDTWVEQTLQKYNDGFVPISETYQRFSANHLFDQDSVTSTINHLHGQICFTHHRPPNHGGLDIGELYKVANYDVIKSLKVLPQNIGTMYTTQSAEQIFQYPIITGLRKNDKILLPPFDAYYSHLYQQIKNNRKLMIIGYGFGDLYINSLLSQFRNFHGNDGKIICIDYISPQKWTHNFYEMPISQTMKQVVYKMFCDEKMPYRFLGFDRLDFIDSEDCKNRLYCCGFHAASTKYKDDILHFYLD